MTKFDPKDADKKEVSWLSIEMWNRDAATHRHIVLYRKYRDKLCCKNLDCLNLQHTNIA